MESTAPAFKRHFEKIIKVNLQKKKKKKKIKKKRKRKKKTKNIKKT